tara:strand:- start:1639 stop:1842 length:204 start_codon:yes stop_codon:yes gene_type:complete
LNYFSKSGLSENRLTPGLEEFLTTHHFAFPAEAEAHYREFIYSVNPFFKSYLFFLKCSTVSAQLGNK